MNENKVIILKGVYPCDSHEWVQNGNTASCKTHLCSAVRMTV